MYLFRRADDRKKPGPWHVQHTVGGRRFRRSTGVFDKALAERKARVMCDRFELEAAGVEPEGPRLSKSCSELVKLYRSYKESLDRDLYNLGQEARWLERTLPLSRPASMVRGGELVELVNRTKRPASRRRLFEYVSAFFRWAKVMGHVQVHPLDGIVKPPKVRAWLKRRALTVDELRALLRSAPFVRAVVYATAARTGLRNKELRLLERRDLDTSSWTITVRAEVSKTGEEALIPVVADLRSWLERLLEERGELAPEARLFVKVERRAEVLYRDLETAGIPKKTSDGRLDFHALRTSFVTWAASSGGVSLVQVQNLARLATASLVQVYARYSLDANRRALEGVAPGALTCPPGITRSSAVRMEKGNCQ